MAGAKLSPRQKMIGMMYLVLTALLALNISKEVLNGFVKVENSLIKTQVTIAEKVNDTFSTLKAKYLNNQEKVGPFFSKAEEVTSDAEEIINCISALGKSFGGINLEDIAAPDCFIIEQKLKEILDIPVFHDDQHGTAIITTAALIRAADVIIAVPCWSS